MPIRSLKVLQHNVLAWTFNRSNELRNIYRVEDPDLILINSHGRKNNENIKIFNYTVYQKNQFNEIHDGVAIAVKCNIKHKIIDNLEENYLAIIVTTNLGEICVATGYQPPRRPFIPPGNLLNFSRRNIPTYILGDFNGRHTILGHRNNNTVGNQIYDHIRDGNLVHLGPDFKTYVSRAQSGTPDLLLGNKNIFHNIHIRPGQLTTSDHIPIIMQISTSPIQTPAAPRLNFNKAKWDDFKTELNKNSIPVLNHTTIENVSNQLDSWITKITTAMTKHIPKKTHRTLPHPKLTEEIRLIQQQYLTLISHIQNGAWTQHQRYTLCQLQTQLQTLCKEESNRKWNELVTSVEVDYKDSAKFWRGIKQLQGGNIRKIPYIVDSHGNKLYTEEEQEAEFRRYWAGIYKITEEDNINFCKETERMVENYLLNHPMDFQPYNTVDLTRLNPNNKLIKPITLKDVMSTIHNFKNKKAPGQTKINKEILTQLPQNMLQFFTNILNAMLSVGMFPEQFKTAILKYIPKPNKAITNVQNHRPISLLEVISKVYEKLINNRFSLYLQENNLNNNNQHSYQKNRGTHTAIALLYEEIAISQSNREQCNIILRDVSKAFDKIYHNGLKFKILQLHLPRIMTSLLCSFLDNRKAKIRMGQYTGPAFNLHSGVPQGSCLSPTLYNWYVADLGELINSNYIQYADDITQIVRYPGKSKEFLRRKTIRAIEEVNTYEKKWKITTNQSKFQILHVSKNKPLPIEINRIKIPYSPEVSILGLKLVRTGIKSHIKEKLKKAKLAFTKLKRFSKMTPKIKLHLYKALVTPHLQYSPVPLNTLSKSNKLKYQAIQNKALRWINGDQPPYHTTVKQLHDKYNIQPLNVQNFTASYRLWERLRTNQENEVNKLEEQRTDASHNWWKQSYINVDQELPPPLYGKSRVRREEGGTESGSEEEEE